MPITVRRIYIIVVILPILCSAVIGWIYVNAINLFRVEVFKKLQCVEIVSFDQRMPQTTVGCVSHAVNGNKGRINWLTKLCHDNKSFNRTLALISRDFINDCRRSARDGGHAIYIAYVLALDSNKRPFANRNTIQGRAFGNVIFKHKPELFLLAQTRYFLLQAFTQAFILNLSNEIIYRCHTTFLHVSVDENYRSK